MNILRLIVGLTLTVTLAFAMAVSAGQKKGVINGAPADVIVQFGQNQFQQDAPPLNRITSQSIKVGR